MAVVDDVVKAPLEGEHLAKEEDEQLAVEEDEDCEAATEKRAAHGNGSSDEACEVTDL